MAITLEVASRLAGDADQLGRDVTNALLAMQTESAELAAGFLCRAAQCLHSSVMLASAGLVGDAMAVMRTSVELLIDLAYILKEDSRSRIEKFERFEDIAQRKLAVGISLLHKGNVDAVAMNEIEERSEEARRLYPTKPNGGLPQVKDWAGNTLSERAGDIGLDAIYRTLYRDACAASHSGMGTLRYVMEGEGDEVGFRWGPAPASVKPAALALYSFLALMSIAFNSFSLESLRDRQDALLAAWSSHCPPATST